MKFWGWIPHLYPSFDLKFEPRLFASTILGLNEIHVRANDNDPDEVSTIRVEPTREFSYGEKCFKTSITIGENQIDSDMTVYSSGMVCFDLTSDQVEPTDGMTEDGIRYAVREIYFSMKKLFHDDIHHETDPLGSKRMQHADDNFAIVKDPDIGKAVVDIFCMIIRKCENTLSMYPNKEDPIRSFDSTVYSLMSGYMSYGRNFLNVNRSILGDSYDVCKESLRSCERSLKGKDREMSNISAMESDAKSLELTQNTAKINKSMFWLTMLSIAVAFFAGSLLADSAIGLATKEKIAIVAVAGTIVMLSAFFIYCTGDKTCEKRKQKNDQT